MPAAADLARLPQNLPQQTRELVPEPDDHARAALEVVDQQPLVRSMRIAGRLGEPEQDNGQAQGVVERRSHRDRAALADVDRRSPVHSLDRPGGRLGRRMVRWREAGLTAVDEGGGHSHSRRGDLGHVRPEGVIDPPGILIGDQARRDLRVGVRGDDRLGAVALEAAPHPVDVQRRSCGLALEHRPPCLARERGHGDLSAVGLIVERQRRHRLALGRGQRHDVVEARVFTSGLIVVIMNPNS